MSKTQHWAILVLSVALFLACLNFDAFYDDGSRSRVWASAWLLSIGWLAALDFIFAWFANPALIVAWILFAFGLDRLAFWTSAWAFLLALSFLAVKEIPVNEAGTTAHVTGMGTGYWLWLASMAVLGVAAGLAILMRAPADRPA